MKNRIKIAVILAVLSSVMGFSYSANALNSDADNDISDI
jgi:hypothetical protein